MAGGSARVAWKAYPAAMRGTRSEIISRIVLLRIRFQPRHGMASGLLGKRPSAAAFGAAAAWRGSITSRRLNCRGGMVGESR